MNAAFSGTGTLTNGTAAWFSGEGSLADDTVYLSAPAAGAGALTVVTGEPYPEPGEFPDFERVLVDLLTPITYTCQVLPPSDDLLQAALPLLLVRRDGGGLDFNAVTDTANMRVVALSHKRSDSWRLARQVREAVLACPGTGNAGVLVDWCEEITGQLEIGDLDPLNRSVEVAFRMMARRQFP
ncbi:hypothetical protein OG326_23835 [Nocardia sp. NBC_01327]|nr:hypothetical protein OG326_23835 [Nocardia sp. NBC_01327]